MSEAPPQLLPASHRFPQFLQGGGCLEMKVPATNNVRVELSLTTIDMSTYL